MQLVGLDFEIDDLPVGELVVQAARHPAREACQVARALVPVGLLALPRDRRVLQLVHQHGGPPAGE